MQTDQFRQRPEILRENLFYGFVFAHSKPRRLCSSAGRRQSFIGSMRIISGTSSGCPNPAAVRK
jgi:hypothetical protein